ncbi:MAG: acyl-CoA/acyl-ACP dehydrogenase [Gammaproteobacteria bacterium]|nr:acyl-CoA/acyl-ACP dehydrogenase [Gammaproteobacteria bacterium]MBU1491866.1 acyl-CoA/acyl-ACP dehydrogenase [Gammaproteobacteria bacterium]MBU2322916.1 acyl-CoA/acyl-ACP dehydrogenase [Gammaproteobacteria bacterium]
MASAHLIGLETMLRDFSRRGIAQAGLEVSRQMQVLHAAGLTDLPHPGQGATLLRWQLLAQVAAADLSLVKLFEAHADARSILHELGVDNHQADGLWAVWAAEPPYAQVGITARTHDQVTLNGRKAWCSGAAHVDHALMTVRDEHNQPALVTLAMQQPGIRVTTDGWQAVGMAAADSVEVVFEGAQAQCIGDSSVYVERPGFWHGAAGIAACWFGAGVALARQVHQQARRDAHSLAHLGAIEAALGTAQAALRACAQWVDEHPRQDAEFEARRLRATVEAAMEAVMQHAGRALGATPFCRDPHFARLMADLPVFLRQSHAERDLERLGQLTLEHPVERWDL